MSVPSSLGRFVNRLLHRRAVRSLAELDDHLLTDMGLQRSDVRRSLAQSIFADPSRALKEACCRWLGHHAERQACSSLAGSR